MRKEFKYSQDATMKMKKINSGRLRAIGYDGRARMRARSARRFILETLSAPKHNLGGATIP